MRARRAQSLRAVYAAVVELDALTDAYRPGAKHERGAPLQRQRLVLLLVCAVEVRRRRLELRGARIHHLPDGPQSEVCAAGAHLLLISARQLGYRGIRKPRPLGAPQRPLLESALAQLLLKTGDVVQAMEEPRVNARLLRKIPHAVAPPQRRQRCPQPGVRRRSHSLQERLIRLPLRRLPQEGASPEFQAAHRLLQCRLERALNSHHLARRLHLRADTPVAARELIKRPARYLHYTVVERGLQSRGRPGCHRVRYLIQPFAERYLRGNPRNGIPGCLGRER